MWPSLMPRSRPGFGDMGGTVLTGSPADFGKLIADETEKWGKVVKFPAPSRTSRAVQSLAC